MKHFLVVALLGLGLACQTVLASPCTVVGQFETCAAGVCVQGTCRGCHSDAECNSISLRCEASSRKCVVVSPMEASWFRGLVAFFGGAFVTVLGTIGGVGGGAVLMPLFAMLLDLPVTAAVVASLACVAGQGLVNVPLVLSRPHPTEARSLVNFQVLSLWLPITSLGMVLGTLVSGFFLQWQKALGQVIVLVFMCLFTFRLNDTLRQRSPRLIPELLLEVEDDGSGSTPRSVYYILMTMGVSITAQVGLHHEACHTYYYWIAAVFGVFGTLQFFLDRNLTFQTMAVRCDQRKIPPSRLHFEANSKTLFQLPFANCLAGVLAVLLGIGSATVSGPLMVAAKLLPEEVSATGGVLTFIIAIQSSAVAVLGSHVLPHSWLVLFAVAGLCGGAVGRVILMPRISRSEYCQHIIVTTMAFVLCAGLVVGLLFSFHTIRDHILNGDPLRFGTMCPTRENVDFGTVI